MIVRKEVDEEAEGLTTAFPTVVVSAQAPTGYDAFSMFAPVVITSSEDSTAQPTRKFEYGPKFRLAG